MTDRDEYLSKHPRTRRAMLDRAIATHGWVCCICGGPIREGDESLQHLRPRSQGGTDDESNLRPAHLRCNAALGARTIDPALVVYGGEALLISWKDAT